METPPRPNESTIRQQFHTIAKPIILWYLRRWDQQNRKPPDEEIDELAILTDWRFRIFQAANGGGLHLPGLNGGTSVQRLLDACEADALAKDPVYRRSVDSLYRLALELTGPMRTSVRHTLEHASADVILTPGLKVEGKRRQNNRKRRRRHGVFPFSKLPAELRNAIYRHLTTSRLGSRDNENDSYDCVEAEELFVGSARLVSRRFKAEYEQEVFPLTRVTLKQHVVSPEIFDWSPMLETRLPGSLLKELTKLRLLVSIVPVRSAEPIAEPATIKSARASAIALAPRFPNLRSSELLILASHCQIEDLYIERYDFAGLLQVETLPSSSLGLKLKKTLIIWADLYNVNEDVVSDEAEQDAIDSDPENSISYRAAVSKVPEDRWCGFDLEVIRIGDQLWEDEALDGADSS